jgi:hypothetical protein
VSRQILRYGLNTVHETIAVDMPAGARLLHFDFQPARNGFSVWCEGDMSPGNRIESRKFIILPTGAEVDPRLTHRGTTLINGGDTVWHLYESAAPQPPAREKM